jgi:hypothetical protein
LPKDIVEEFKKSERYKKATPELVKAVEQSLKETPKAGGAVEETIKKPQLPAESKYKKGDIVIWDGQQRKIISQVKMGNETKFEIGLDNNKSIWTNDLMLDSEAKKTLSLETAEITKVEETIKKPQYETETKKEDGEPMPERIPSVRTERERRPESTELRTEKEEIGSQLKGLVERYNTLNFKDKKSASGYKLLNEINQRVNELGYGLKSLNKGKFQLLNERGKIIKKEGIKRSSDEIQEEKRKAERLKRAKNAEPQGIEHAVALDIANGVKFDHEELKRITGLTDRDIPFGYTRKDGKGKKIEFYIDELKNQMGDKEAYGEGDMEAMSEVAEAIKQYMVKGGRMAAIEYVDEMQQRAENPGRMTDSEIADIIEQMGGNVVPEEVQQAEDYVNELTEEEAAEKYKEIIERENAEKSADFINEILNSYEEERKQRGEYEGETVSEDTGAEVESKPAEEEIKVKPQEYEATKKAYEEAQEEYSAAKTTFEEKRKKLDKEILKDQENLFGERKSQEETKLFDERVDQAQRGQAIAKEKARLDAAEKNLKKAKDDWDKIKDKETSGIFGADEIAKRIRNKKQGGAMSAIDFGLSRMVYNGALEFMAKQVEKGTKLGNAIAKTMRWIDEQMEGKKWDKGAFAKYMNDEYKVKLGNGEVVDVVRDDTKETAEVINGFYLPIEQKILDTKQESMPANKWAEVLRSKEDEDLYTGVREYLESRGTSTVTKKELKDFIKNNRIEIVEVVKGGDVIKKDDNKLLEIESQLESMGFTLELDMGGEGNMLIDEDGEIVEYEGNEDAYALVETYNELSDSSFNQYSRVGQSDAKFSQYQLEGEKENYKEVLITLPNKSTKTLDDISKELYGVDYAGLSKEYPSSSLSKEINAQKVFERYKNSDLTGFKSSHFDEPNILVHLRMNTRYSSKENKDYLDPKTHKPNFDEGFELIDNGDNYQVKKIGSSSPYFNTYSKKTMSDNNMSINDLKEYLMAYDRLGKLHPDFADNKKSVPVKVLFLEEIQSDWGQEGKKKGFDNKQLEAKRNELLDKMYALELEHQSYTKRTKVANTGNVSDYRLESTNEKRQKEIEIEVGKLDAEVKKINSQTGITPEAPFVTDTNSWVRLGLKYALKQAVEQGADKLAWTTGEQQNDRYDLSKSVSEIGYKNNGDGTYGITVLSKGSRNILLNEKNATISFIESNLGKDIAKKIESGEGKVEGGVTSISGNNLKVGGKGMKGFYGSIQEGKTGILGGVVESLTGQKVGEIKIDTSDDDGVVMQSNLPKQPSIDITPEIKKYVKEGMPLFKGKEIPKAVAPQLSQEQIVEQGNKLDEMFNLERTRDSKKSAMLQEEAQKEIDKITETLPKDLVEKAKFVKQNLGNIRTEMEKKNLLKVEC